MNNDFDLKSFLGAKKSIIESKLDEITKKSGTSEILNKAVRYSLLAGGKRLRPVLCMSAEEMGLNKEKSVLCGCAIEMIHTYSLIHDDLPAMDDDDLRRGIETNHKKFDEATAILAGDALLTKAFEILTMQDIEPEKIVETIKIVSAASGESGMVSGQVKDIDSESKLISIEELKTLHMEKTGALIRASLNCGSVIGEIQENKRVHLDEYGKLIGLAFQVVDDILDISGDPLVMGKPSGTDEKNNKATYPLLMGMEKSEKFAGDLIAESIEHLSCFGEKALPLRVIAEYILNRKK